MCVFDEFPPVQKTLRSHATSNYWEPYTDWMPLTGVDAIRFVWAQQALEDNFRGMPGYQLSAVRIDRPDDPVQVGTPWSGTGYNGRELDLSSVTSDHFWVRYGMFFDYNGSPTLGQADVELRGTFQNNGRVLGRRTHQVHVQGSGTVYYPVTGFVPAAGVEEAKAAMVISGKSGTLSLGVSYRTADTDPEDPNAWTALSTPSSVSGTNESRIVSDTSVSTSGKGFIQFAIAAESSASDGQATVSLAVAGRTTTPP